MDTKTSIKTRFAPSPTGYLHVGGLRTALYSYLYAKKNGGTFLLRIEDTDQKRYVEGAVESLIDILKLFGLNWDEGPFFQSQRTEIYRAHAARLIESGQAYRCFCSEERLTKMREDQSNLHLPPKYDRHCLELSKEEIDKLIAAGTPFVVRQLIPTEEIVFNDLIRGEVRFHGKDVDDQVLIKSDNFPTYHLANVVDDHEMGITHVIRGEEWLPSTPKHIWLYKAFGWTPPEFAHLPLLLNPDHSKLSKRQGDVAAEDFIKKGYLKEAMLNFIAFLGWNPGTEEEIFSLEELVDRFSLDRVQKGGAIFNLEKLDWLNGQYIRKMTPKDLGEAVLPYLQKESWYTDALLSRLSDDQKTRILVSIQSRLKTLAEAPALLRPFLLENLDYNLALFSNEKMKVDRAGAILAIENVTKALETPIDFNSEESIKAALVSVIEKLGLKNGQVLWPVRVALTNEEFSPGVFELILVMGKDFALTRLHAARKALDSAQG
ncbi:MAG: glutamate--tRNA ligase [Candidatus Gracilibacteria bacterium]|jgi:glutamyl-tRNA synthetase